MHLLPSGSTLVSTCDVELPPLDNLQTESQQSHHTGTLLGLSQAEGKAIENIMFTIKHKKILEKVP